MRGWGWTRTRDVSKESRKLLQRMGVVIWSSSNNLLFYVIIMYSAVHATFAQVMENHVTSSKVLPLPMNHLCPPISQSTWRILGPLFWPLANTVICWESPYRTKYNIPTPVADSPYKRTATFRTGDGDSKTANPALVFTIRKPWKRDISIAPSPAILSNC
jgi:hypothetical protein